MTTVVKEKFADRPKVAAMFERCLLNTLHTTIRRQNDGTTFVITGDIPAMWLRDSALQVRPYLYLAAEDEALYRMISGLVELQMRYIRLDPYANAFNAEPNGNGHQTDDTEMGPWIWERKYEVDSLCYPLQLSCLLWKNTGRTDHFTSEFLAAARVILDTWKTEQHHRTRSEYSFQRADCPPTDTLPHDGRGAPVGYTGMTWSGFRPSDDACTYGYLIPSNLFAAKALTDLADIASNLLNERELAAEAAELASQIRQGVERYGIVEHPRYGRMLAYETDGLGNYNLMDDANVPSLLSLPYLGCLDAEDPLYRNTRAFVLSEQNPYFFAGDAAEGIGSPHTPHRYIWHIALAMQGLTATDPEEKRRMLDTLLRTDAGTGMMHEGFHADDPTRFTREWFSWANMMFCELVMDLCDMRVKR